MFGWIFSWLYILGTQLWSDGTDVSWNGNLIQVHGTWINYVDNIQRMNKG